MMNTEDSLDEMSSTVKCGGLNEINFEHETREQLVELLKLALTRLSEVRKQPSVFFTSEKQLQAEMDQITKSNSQLGAHNKHLISENIDLEYKLSILRSDLKLLSKAISNIKAEVKVVKQIPKKYSE